MAILQHECGLAAIYVLSGFMPQSRLLPHGDPKLASSLLPRMLLDLQNRGQLAAGMATYDPNREKLLDTHKELGTVIEAFRLNHKGKSKNIQQEYAASAGIGHVRYATCGTDERSYAQPFNRYHGCKWKWFSFAFNGQLANYGELKNELLQMRDYHLTRDTDTEVIMHYLSHELRGDAQPDLVEVFKNLGERFDGAYNIVYMNAMGDMVISRDPNGIRPMCWAMDGNLFAAASESVALQNLGFTQVNTLQPGEMIIIEDGQFRLERFAPKKTPKHCFFEWIYFANVASELDGHSVYLTRNALGIELAQQEKELGIVPLDDDTIVVPVPDTAKAAADAMAFALKLPSVEGLMRNRYVGRTFIEGENREARIRAKYTPLRQVLEGKRVLLVEDTIVRSSTMKALLGVMRSVGHAKEIHVRVACPPIIAPCFYGIDMSTIQELFAPRFLHGQPISREYERKMAQELGADSLAYLPVESLARCIGIQTEKLCRACVTGEYPTPVGEQLYQLSLKPACGDRRTYEK
ncbi:MAG: amidophosphoribosyltransferase [Planctomycetia bacterium]|nr:amidophosphoribosyltransferase [Planctomycetia bacterium]